MSAPLWGAGGPTVLGVSQGWGRPGNAVEDEAFTSLRSVLLVALAYAPYGNIAHGVVGILG